MVDTSGDRAARRMLSTPEHVAEFLKEVPVDHGTPIYKALEAIVNDEPSPEEAQQQIADILVAALGSYAQVTGLPAPGLFYVGTDNRAYRLDGPSVEFSNRREANLANGLISGGIKVIHDYLRRQAGGGDSEGRARAYSMMRPAAQDAPSVSPVTTIPLGSPAELEIIDLPRVLRYVASQLRVREGRVWNGRFWWVDMEADAWVSTDLYRGPMPGKCFVRLAGKHYTNEFAEGEVKGAVFEGWASAEEPIKTKKFTVTH